MLAAAGAAAAYLFSLLVTGSVTAGLVLVVAGPHAGLLPPPLEPVVVFLGWVVVVVLPAVVAARVWRRLSSAR